MINPLEWLSTQYHFSRNLIGLLGAPCAFDWRMHHLRRKLGMKTQPELWLRPRNLAYPVKMRGGDSSDAQVFSQTLIAQQYAPLAQVKDARRIIDGGANVGFTSAYFLSRFPEAQVVAVEPDPRNFAMLQQNLAPYGARAICVRGAIWGRRMKLALQTGAFGDGREWASQVRGAEAGESSEVEAYDLPALIQMLGAGPVDILKLDVERSELDIFNPAGGLAWLRQVRNIAIELHGPDCEEVFFRALEGLRYDRGRLGEVTFCRNLGD